MDELPCVNCIVLASCKSYIETCKKEIERKLKTSLVGSPGHVLRNDLNSCAVSGFINMCPILFEYIPCDSFHTTEFIYPLTKRYCKPDPYWYEKLDKLTDFFGIDRLKVNKNGFP